MEDRRNTDTMRAGRCLQAEASAQDGRGHDGSTTTRQTLMPRALNSS